MEGRRTIGLPEVTHMRDPKGKCDVAAPRNMLRNKRHRLIVVAEDISQYCDEDH